MRDAESVVCPNPPALWVMLIAVSPGAGATPEEDAKAGHDPLNIGLTFTSPAAYSLRSSGAGAPY